MNTKTLTRIVMIAVVYTVLSLVLAPISFGPIQCRVSEALTILAIGGPLYMVALTFGCFLTNLLGVIFNLNGIGIMDVFFGTAATLLGCLLAYWLRNIKFKDLPVVSAFMPVLTNGVIIGLELAVLYGGLHLWPVMGIEVAVGEAIACVLGLVAYKFMGNRLFVLNK